MQCEQIQSNFSALQEDQLDAAMKLKVEGHISDCKSCNDVWESFKTTWTALEAIPMVEAPIFLHARIMDSIEFDTKSSEPWYSLFISRLKLLVKQPMAVGATACALIAAMVGYKIANTQQASLAPSLFSHSQAMGIAAAKADWMPTHNGTLEVIVTANNAGSGDVIGKLTLIRLMPDNLTTVVNSAKVDLTRGESRKVELTGADPNDLSQYRLSITTPNGQSTPIEISNIK